MTLETVQIATNIIIAVAASFGTCSLIFYLLTLKHQRDAISTSIYLQTTGRINELVERTPATTPEEKADRAVLVVLGAFENFAFYDNEDYFTPAMTNQYLGTIYMITKRFKDEGLLAGTSAAKENAFVELRKFLLKHKGEDPLK